MRRIYADDLPYDPNDRIPENFAGDRCVHDPNEPNILSTLNDGVDTYLKIISRLPIMDVLVTNREK